MTLHSLHIYHLCPPADAENSNREVPGAAIWKKDPAMAAGPVPAPG